MSINLWKKGKVMTDDRMQPNPGLNSSRALGFVNQGHITDRVILMTTSEQVKDKSVCLGV